MLILQLTDGPSAMTSWFPPHWPYLLKGKDCGGGMKDVRLPPQWQCWKHRMSWDASPWSTGPFPATATSPTTGRKLWVEHTPPQQLKSFP